VKLSSKRQLLAICLLLASGHAVGHTDEVASPPIVTANVKQLQRPAASTPDAMPMMAVVNQTPVATLPAERLPQYRIGYQRTDAMLQSQVKAGAVKFLLTEPTMLQQIGRPLLIEATILINDQPFSSVRDQLAAEHVKTASELQVDEQEPAELAEEEVVAEEEDVATEEAADDASEKPVMPATEPAYELASDSQTLLKRYAAAVGETLGDAEAQWLMTHWTEGPTLLVLHPYYQSFRAEQRPAFVVLDKDRDGIVSKAEIDEAAESFRRCDANRDEIVDALEIAKAADGLRDATETHEPSGPLFWLLPDLVGVTDEDPVIYQSIATLDTNQNGKIEATEIDTFSNQSPEIRLRVAFDAGDAGSSKLHVIGLNESLNIVANAAQQSEGVNLSIGSLTIHLSAIQSASSPSPSGQVSIGAVVDGYPLLPELDPNGDGRFTIREMRTLTDELKALDRNTDQSLSLEECGSPIRVCIGLGAIVHEELANLRSAQPAAPVETIVGPQWFVRMDRNQDGDLTRGEFPGMDEQFVALDADGDALISASEANEFDKRTD
jgi:hypothetical protein